MYGVVVQKGLHVTPYVFFQDGYQSHTNKRISVFDFTVTKYPVFDFN